jgi:hypothetical protein
VLKQALITAVLGLALLAGTAEAQTSSTPATAPCSRAGAINPQQLLLGVWASETASGANVAIYLPDGSVNGVLYLPGERQPIPFVGSWSVRALAADRFELAVRTAKHSGQSTLRVMPDGNIYNETAQAVAWRIY